MSDYKPTVYEQIVTDFLAGKNLNYNDYKEELSARGWSESAILTLMLKIWNLLKS